MRLEQSPDMFVQRLSIWKTICMELVLATGAVLPLTANFSKGLTYTAFFYEMPFFILLVAACVVLGLLALVFLLFVWRAILRVPVLNITEEGITVLGRRRRTVAKSDVMGLVHLWPGGNINLQIRGQPPLAISAWLYDEPQLTLNLLAPERKGSLAAPS